MAACTKVRDRVEENRSDVSLVGLAVGGDAIAWERLDDRYRALYRQWIRNWLKHRQWLDDCTATAVNELYRKLPQYKPALSAFATWAYRVARTRCIKFVRDYRTNREVVSTDEPSFESIPALHGPEHDHIMRRVHDEVAKLEPEQRRAVEGHFFEGLSDEELEEELHIPRRQVCYRRKQGLAILKRQLADVLFTSI
jgi:RNA polymerase sigma factor (sigma-70 family)